MANKQSNDGKVKATFTVNNFEVFSFDDLRGEVYIQTDVDTVSSMTYSQLLDANGGRVYLRIGDLKALLAFAEAQQANARRIEDNITLQAAADILRRRVTGIADTLYSEIAIRLDTIAGKDY